MADAEPARRAGEAPVGDQRDLAAHALPVERGRRRQHFAHAGAALRPLVADHKHVAFPYLRILYRLEAGFFAVETTRRSGEMQAFHPGNLNDRAFGREIAFQADDTAGRQDRLVGRMDDILVGVPDTLI